MGEDSDGITHYCCIYFDKTFLWTTGEPNENFVFLLIWKNNR